MINLYLENHSAITYRTFKKMLSNYEVTLWGENDPNRDQLQKCSLVVIFHEAENLEALLEIVDGLRSKMSNQELWVCAPGMGNNRYLEKSGVNRVMEPQGWTCDQVMERLLADLTDLMPQEETVFGAIQGISPSMKELYSRISKISRLKESVLVLGETGCGKGMIAQEVHRCSKRPGKELVKVNCAAFSADRLEAELFGHVKGAFTDAARDRPGLLLEAGEGSLFLDEIGELALHSQVKLLDVAEDKLIRPLGGNQQIPIEARLIFATNKDLDQEVAMGRFREDLYQRLRHFTLHLPPLRERRADILLLAKHFLDVFNKKYTCNLKLPHSCRDPLFKYDWPGNVRELQNVITQAAGLSDSDDEISPEFLLEALRGGSRSLKPDLDFQFDPTKMKWKEVETRLKTVYLRKVLDVCSSKNEAMEISGFKKARFYELLKELKLN